MNRIRTIKPEMRRNRKIADCGILATLLSRELITYADDQGRFPASAREVKAECFPYHDALKTVEVEKAIEALANPLVGFIELYEVDGERYGWIPGWFKHQQLKADRVTWSELPPPPGFDPKRMKQALFTRWLQDGSKGDLPPRGDGSLPCANGLQDGTGPETPASNGAPVGSGPEPDVSNLEPKRRQVGDASEPVDSILEPRARRRAGADRTGPDRIGTERNSPLPPSPGDRETEDLLADYHRWLDAYREATGLPGREETLSRDAYLGRRREGLSAADLEHAARGIALDSWWMSPNSDGIPRCNPTTMLKNSKLQTWIALGRGEISPGPRGAGPSRLEAIAGAMDAAALGPPGVEPLRLGEGTA